MNRFLVESPPRAQSAREGNQNEVEIASHHSIDAREKSSQRA
jgi:hypothetical protein